MKRLIYTLLFSLFGDILENADQYCYYIDLVKFTFQIIAVLFTFMYLHFWIS